MRTSSRAQKRWGLCAAIVLGQQLLWSGCGGSQLDPVRFRNAPPVWAVNDRLDVSNKPRERPFVRAPYFFEAYAGRRLVRAASVPRYQRAQNTNSLDEVPNSTWFTNRIGVRDMTEAEVALGPNDPFGPESFRPWKILSSKADGVSKGFLVADSRGIRYLLKFEEPGHPEMQSAADVIAARILWACGYNVPQDHVVHLRPEDLQIAEGAVVKEPLSTERPMTEEFVRRTLRQVDTAPDGSIRAIASRIIEGEPLGGWPAEGVRDGDPNDLVPHELRRELRGAYVFFAWLDHEDIKEGNTLDLWVRDPEDPDIRYVVHYLLDFDISLGGHAVLDRSRNSGHSYTLDFAHATASLVSLGLWRRSWEDLRMPGIRGVGLWESSHFDPGSWKPLSPADTPILRHDRFDGFWAAKIIARLSRPLLRAIVAQAEYSDPRAAPYVLRILEERRIKTLRYWFSRVNPIDSIQVTGAKICFEDLARKHGIAPMPARYRATAFDYSGVPTGWRAEARAHGSQFEVCLEGLRPGPGPDGYLILELRTERAGDAPLPATLLHLARDPQAGGALRLIGLRRL